MFEYFPNNYPWNLAVMGGLNRGGQISEIDEACRPLKEIAARKNDPAAQDAWFQSFMKLAERVERLGDVDTQANHPLSAGRKYMRAGLYYLLAERMPSHKDPRRLIAYKRGIEIYAKGLKARREPVEFVEVPYGEHRLPAYFMRAPVNGRAPCMVHFDGFDVTKEIIYGATAEEYRRRGISLLIVDHPGVGAALRLSEPALLAPHRAAGQGVRRLSVDPSRRRSRPDRDRRAQPRRLLRAARRRLREAVQMLRRLGRDLRFRRGIRGAGRRHQRAVGAGLRRSRAMGVRDQEP